MSVIDFEYDQHFLSDYGFVVCDFDFSSGAAVTSAGSQISFNKVSRNYGKKYSLVGIHYDECIQTTFDICKNPDENEADEMIITNDEFRDLMRWLNRKEFLRFRTIDDTCSDDEERITCYFDASFNVEKIKIADDLVGLRLTMETNRPFGYSQEVTDLLEFTSGSTQIVYDRSDEIGDTFPDVVITVTEAGNLSLENTTLDITTVINNCAAGEVITFQGEEQIISSSLSTHDIANDFNYEFLRISNSFDDRANTFTSNLACTVEITYAPVIKDVP